MREVSGAQAAAELGVSIDTIKRRIASGDLLGHKDAGGRWRVVLEDKTPAATAEVIGTATTADPIESRLALELDAATAMIAQLRSEVTRMATQIEQDAVERAELRRLLSTAMQRPQLPATVEGERLDAAGQEPAPTRNVPASARKWWQVWKRDTQSP